MSQASPTIGANKSGLTYRQEDNDGKKALLTQHKGASAPDYAEAGMIWLDDAATPWLLKCHDGADWIVLGAVHAADNAFVPHNGTASQRLLPYSIDSGSANALAVTPVPAPAAYAAGQMVVVQPAYAVTDASTLTVGALAAQDIIMPDGTPTPTGVMLAGAMYVLVHDGSAFVLSNPTQSPVLPAGAVIDSQSAQYSVNANLYTIIPPDNTIPQAGEGTEILSVTLTPKNAANIVRVRFQGFGASSGAGVSLVASLILDAGPAVAASAVNSGASGTIMPIGFCFEHIPGDTAPHTYSVRVGPSSSGSIRMNGSMSSRMFGGTAAATLTVEEIKG